MLSWGLRPRLYAAVRFADSALKPVAFYTSKRDVFLYSNEFLLVSKRVSSMVDQLNEVKHFPCSSCGADLVYEPGDGFLTCPYCGHKEAIPESAARVEEQPFEQHLQIRPEQMAKLAINALEVQCQSCGAKSIFTPPEVAGRCEFCGVQIVAQPTSADPILTPGGVLPFRITQPQASQNFVNGFQQDGSRPVASNTSLNPMRSTACTFLSGPTTQAPPLITRASAASTTTKLKLTTSVTRREIRCSARDR